MPSRQPELAAPTPRHSAPAGVSGRERAVVQPVRAARRASDRAARGTPSTAARPRPSSTSPCGRPRRRSGRSAVGLGDADEHGRNEVRQLDPARGGVEHVGRHLQAVPDLRPEPLGRVRAADRREVARARAPRAVAVIAAASSARGVVLPEPGVRRQVVAQRRVERQRPGRGIDRERRRSRRVHADADHARRAESPALSRPPRARRAPLRADRPGSRPGSGGRGADRAASSSTPWSPRRVVEHVRADRRAIGDVHDDGADGVGAEVEADRERRGIASAEQDRG